MNYYCHHCNAIVLPTEKSRAEFDGEHIVGPEGMPIFWIVTTLLVYICPRCSSPFLVRVEQQCDPDAETYQEPKEEMLYPAPSLLNAENLPEIVSRPFTSANNAFRSSDYDVCVMMTRKAIECTCKHFLKTGDGSYPKRNLVELIRELRSMNKIDDMLKDWFDMIRELGNNAVHEPDAAFTKLQARNCLDFAEAIIGYVFIYTPKYDEYARTKKPIPKRQARSGSVQELKTAVTTLSTEDLTHFSQWLKEYTAG